MTKKYDSPTDEEQHQLLSIMESRGCDYYDYTAEKLDLWRAHMQNSEVNDYTFIEPNIAVFKNGLGVGVRKYHRNTVYSWFILNKDLKEVS